MQQNKRCSKEKQAERKKAKKEERCREKEREGQQHKVILPCGSRSMKSLSSGASFSSSACISTPKSSSSGSGLIGVEVQEVAELKRASGNGDAGCCCTGEFKSASCMGEGADPDNKKTGVSPTLSCHGLIYLALCVLLQRSQGLEQNLTMSPI